jgi:hypothetical protein
MSKSSPDLENSGLTATNVSSFGFNRTLRLRSVFILHLRIMIIEVNVSESTSEKKPTPILSSDIHQKFNEILNLQKNQG